MNVHRTVLKPSQSHGKAFDLYLFSIVMRKTLIVIAGLTLCAASTSFGAISAQAGIKTKPCAVQKIYVDDFGNDPRHVNFRLWLEKWLKKKKFTVVNRSQDADAVLSGKLSIRSGDKDSNLSFKDAELKTANGLVVWHGNFDRTTNNTFGWLGRGHIENGAKRIAENVRASCT